LSAIVAARSLFNEHGQDFEQQLGWYLTRGVVVSTPDRFIMAKPIRADRGDDEWGVKDADAWYVHVAVGDGALRWFLSQAPFALPKLAWRRVKDPANRLRVYPTSSFARHA
jgi:hypothetical protein